MFLISKYTLFKTIPLQLSCFVRQPVCREKIKVGHGFQILSPFRSENKFKATFYVNVHKLYAVHQNRKHGTYMFLPDPLCFPAKCLFF